MNYIAISHDEYLAHYGVKGMKWGVRRQQKKDARARRKERRKTRNDILNSQYNLEREFDNTPNGKKLKSSFEKWRDKTIYESLNDILTDDHLTAYNKAQEAYARKRGAYVYDALRSKHSDEAIRDALTHPFFGYSMNIPANKSTRDAFIEDHVNTHYNNAFD